MRHDLEAQLAVIERQLSDHGASWSEEGSLEVAVDEGFGDSAQATAERAEILSLINQLKTAHAEVRAALARIDDGSYGRCQSCGRDIPFERLEVVPTATQCLACKQSGAPSPGA